MTEQPLWQPSAERVAAANLTAFAARAGLPTDYGQLHRWSIQNQIGRASCRERV